jgi:hypothetical protein
MLQIINKIALKTKDGFLIRLYFENSDFLISDFIIFLRNLKAPLGLNKNNVAQYINYLKLSAHIRAIINLVEMSKHFDFTGNHTPLLLERELLVFQSAVLDFLQKEQKVPELKGTGEASNVKKEIRTDKFPKSKSKLEIGGNQEILETEPFDETAKRILDIIKRQPGLTLKEVNSLAVDLNRRTIERKLIGLIELGFVQKEQEGSKKILLPHQ